MGWIGAGALVRAEVIDEGLVPDQYIVTLQPSERASEMAKQHGLTVGHVYAHALNGFSAFLPEGRLNALKKDSRVAAAATPRYV